MKTPYIFFTLLLVSNVSAYIDPGTGSMIFQVLIASFMGILFMVKVYWNKIKTCLKNILSPDKKKQ